VLLNFWRITDSDKTPYSDPKAFSMQKVAEISWGALPYYFDITAVLRRVSDGTLWYASDAGCSCPDPFQDKLTWTRLFNLEPLRLRGESYRQPDMRQYRAFLAKVDAAFGDLRAEREVRDEHTGSQEGS
jgi:hypothetical protein